MGPPGARAGVAVPGSPSGQSITDKPFATRGLGGLVETPSPDGVLDAATDAYVATDTHGLIVGWNHQATRLLGWSRHEAMGNDLLEVILPASSRSDPAPSVGQLLDMAQGPPRGRRITFEAADRDGRRFPVEAAVWVTTHKDGPILHSLLQDVSERRQSQESLYRMAALVYSLDEAILGVNLDGTIVSWNSGAERTFGYSGFEMVGQKVSSLVPDEQRQQVERWWPVLEKDGDAQRHELGGIRKNGVLIDLAMTVSPIRNGDGGVTGASVIARDVTRQRWIARTLETTLESLETALKETRESEARCRRFLGDAAHQLRTPIAGIRACAETLLRGASPAERDSLLINVVRETSRASRVMTGLLRMARLDQGESLTFQPCDLVTLCTEEAERFQNIAPDLEIGVRTVGETTSRPLLDAGVVHEILSNLLDNARRHASRCIEVVVEVGTEGIEVRVLDDGPGLADGDVDRAFDRFVSLDGRGGSGLGLPVAKGLARAHDGDLTYEAGFVLRLPPNAEAIGCGGAGRPGPLPAL